MIVKAKVIQGNYGKQVKHNNQWWNIGTKDGAKVTVGEIYTFELVVKPNPNTGNDSFFANLVEEQTPKMPDGVSFRNAVLAILKDVGLLPSDDAPAKKQKKRADDKPDDDTKRPWEIDDGEVDEI